MKKFLDGLNTHGIGAVGATIFTPALAMLTNQSYAERLVHHYLPHLNADLVPLVGALLVGVGGLLLYYARPHNVAQ